MNTSTWNRMSDHLPIGMLLPMALAVYVLSVGPVLISAERLGVSQTRRASLRVLYSPVLATARSGEVGVVLYESYVGMWHRIIMGRPYPDAAKYR